MSPTLGAYRQTHMDIILGILELLINTWERIPPGWQRSSVIVISLLVAVVWTCIVGMRTWIKFSDWSRRRHIAEKQNCVNELRKLANDLIHSQVEDGRLLTLARDVRLLARIKVRKLQCERWKLAPPKGSSIPEWRPHIIYIAEFLDTSNLRATQKENKRLNKNRSRLAKYKFWMLNVWTEGKSRIHNLPKRKREHKSSPE